MGLRLRRSMNNRWSGSGLLRWLVRVARSDEAVRRWRLDMLEILAQAEGERRLRTTGGGMDVEGWWGVQTRQNAFVTSRGSQRPRQRLLAPPFLCANPPHADHPFTLAADNGCKVQPKGSQRCNRLDQGGHQRRRHHKTDWRLITHPPPLAPRCPIPWRCGRHLEPEARPSRCT